MPVDFKELEQRAGVTFGTGFAPKILDDQMRRTMDAQMRRSLGMDSELITDANAGILQIFTTYVDPRVLEVLVEPMKAASIFGETHKGTWVDDNLQFPIGESTGETSSYDDYSENGMVGTNINWETREPYYYQAIVEVGERELARAGAAKLDWAARQQMAAALTLNKYQNKTYWYGVSGKKCYGMLNDPSLLPSILGDPWAGKTAEQVLTECQRLYNQLIKQTQGLIDRDAPLILLMSPEQETNLLKTNQYNVNVMDQLKKNYPNLEVETAPELSTDAGELVQLIVREYEGERTVEPTFTSKMRVHQMVLGLSSWRQKRSQGTVGTIIYRPMFIASLLAS